MNLVGKKILLIAPQFFGYEREILAELIRQGAEVDYIPDRPFSSPFMKAVMRYWKNLVLPLADRFFQNQIRKYNRSHYDYFFVVKGEGLSGEILSFIRTRFPEAIFICYLWDSQNNKGALSDHLDKFDKCYTFDHADANEYGLIHRPLFYSSKFLSYSNSKLKYDLSFVGTSHSDRYRIASELKTSLPRNRVFFCYLYLQSKWLFYVYKIFKSDFRKAKINEFNFTSLPLGVVAQIFSESFAILDVEHPNQSGLTMRTFEILAAGKKMITTNMAVIDADFYSPNNILLLRRGEKIDIPASFFNNPFQRPTEDIMHKYSIVGWISDIFSD